METNTKPSLLKQAMGAVVGSAVALALYYGYEFAAPRVTAYVTLPPAERQHDLGDVRTADENATPEELARIQSRNQEVADFLEGADPQDYKLDNPEWDSTWPTEAPPKEITPPPQEPKAEVIPVADDDGWQDFIREAAPAPTPTQTAPAQVAVHSSAPALPDSGFGAVAAAVAAFGATASRFQFLFKRKTSRK